MISLKDYENNPIAKSFKETHKEAYDAIAKADHPGQKHGKGGRYVKTGGGEGVQSKPVGKPFKLGGDTNRLISGSGFVGKLENITYDQIKSVLGEPTNGLSSDKKIKAEWRIGFDDGEGDIATIYDYKSDKSPEQNTVWHVGGKKDKVFKKVKQLFEEGAASSSNAMKFDGKPLKVSGKEINETYELTVLNQLKTRVGKPKFEGIDDLTKFLKQEGFSSKEAEQVLAKYQTHIFGSNIEMYTSKLKDVKAASTKPAEKELTESQIQSAYADLDEKVIKVTKDMENLSLMRLKIRPGIAFTTFNIGKDNKVDIYYSKSGEMEGIGVSGYTRKIGDKDAMNELILAGQFAEGNYKKSLQQIRAIAEETRDLDKKVYDHNEKNK